MCPVADTVEHAQLDRSPDYDVRRAQVGVKRKALAELPIIDMRPFVADDGHEQRARIGRQVREACIDIGFFYITGHTFSNGEFEELLDWGRRFFALPREKKMTVAVNEHSSNMGFLQIGGLNPQANVDKRPDRKERLFLTRDLMPGEMPGGTSPAGRAQWPSDDVLPGFTRFVKGQIVKRIELARAIGRAFALSLELPENHFDRYYDHLGCMHAFNYYPPQDPQAGGDAQWGFSPHTDYGSFTILLQDQQGGLQARNCAGEWIDVPPVDGTFVVNVGDLMARWTNDFYVSTMHRAINLKAVPRISNSFFVYPDVHAEIRCLDTCQSPQNPPRYAPVNSGQYIEQLLAQAYRTGRVGISSRTAERIQQSN